MFYDLDLFLFFSIALKSIAVQTMKNLSVFFSSLFLAQDHNIGINVYGNLSNTAVNLLMFY